jgi:transposase
MPQNFLSCDRDQPLLLPPDLRDWLDEDHLAWFVIEAIEELDLEPFYGAYRRDGHGRSAHEPKMMVMLLAYAYAVGERSSRGIERRCRDDVAFRVICANQVPDHATIARFRVRHQAALADLFGQVLGLCAEAGLVEAGVIAVDGSKLAAAASDKAVRSYERLAEEILAEAGRIDAAEDDIHGPARGDELPEGLSRRIDSLRERGMTPIVAPDTTRNRPRKTRLGGPYDFMRRVLATERGGELYSKRQCMVEPVFAQIKANRRIDRLKRRGRAAARSEWRLIAATHNLLKLHRHSLAAAAV